MHEAPSQGGKKEVWSALVHNRANWFLREKRLLIVQLNKSHYLWGASIPENLQLLFMETTGHKQPGMIQSEVKS
jgi:hypothetical protein